MRIKRAEIYGFGKWIDQEWTFPEKGPFIIYGENESGKTTLHQFILFMLFGLPPRQRKFYQPKTSSKMGGRLIIYDSEVGEFIVERLNEKNNGQATCFIEGRETYDENWLQERLQGLDKKTYEAIFSFSSLDLSGIQEMNEADLGEVLLGIGMTGSSDIYHIEKQLETHLGNLFKPNGKLPNINKQLETLDALSKKLKENKREEARYHKITEQLATTKKTMEAYEQDIIQVESNKSSIVRQVTALPVIQDYQYLYKKQGEFQNEPRFPENGIYRLEELKEHLHPLESEYAVLQHNKERVQRELESLQEDMLADNVYDALKELKIELTFLLDKEEEIEGLQSEESKGKEKVEEELDYLQIDQSIINLQDLFLPFYLEETWKQMKTEKEAISVTETNIDLEKKSLQEEEKFLKEEKEILQSELLPKAEVEVLKNKRDEGIEYEQLSKWYDVSLKKNQEFKEQKAVKSKKSIFYLGSSIVFSLSFLIFGFVTDRSIFQLLGVSVLIIGASQWLFIKNNWKRLEEYVQMPEGMTQMDAISQEELSQIEKELEVQEQKQREIEHIQVEIQKQQIRTVKLEEKQRIFLERKQRLKHQTEEQYIFYPFLKQIDLVYWPEYYQRLKLLLKKNEEWNQIKGKLIESRDEFNLRKERVYQRIQEHFPNQLEKELNVLLKWLISLLRNDEELKQRYRHYEDELSRIIESTVDMEKRMKVFYDEINTLFAIAGVEAEEAFYQIGSYIADKEAYQRAMEENEKQLDAIFPQQEWKLFIDEPLEKYGLDQKQKTISYQLEKLHKEYNKLRDELAALNAERNQLEHRETYSDYLHLFEMEKEKMSQLADEWAVLKLEKEVLAEAKQQYQEKYLTSVIVEATNYFEIITGGKYVKVYAPVEKQPFLVMSKEGLRYTINELSQGTVNQLYVALRFAINKVMAEKHQLPFILDDAFVHFDSPRVHRIIHILNDIAKKQQIIFLTCKQDFLQASTVLGIPYKKI